MLSWSGRFAHLALLHNFNAPQLLRSYLICVYLHTQHDATGLGTINTVTAVVTITDIPINPYVANGAVTVKQSFGVQFSSVDTTKSTNVNGNLFFRYTIVLNHWMIIWIAAFFSVARFCSPRYCYNYIFRSLFAGNARETLVICKARIFFSASINLLHLTPPQLILLMKPLGVSIYLPHGTIMTQVIQQISVNQYVPE